jgi:4-aminobutyrate aminotransferase-like enzyme
VLPELNTVIPGPKSLALAERLRRNECRNVTFLSPEFPVFWERAQGANVWDADGNRFLDLTSGFGVATAGHGAPHLLQVFASQPLDLYHGLGDVHPSRLKADLCEALSKATFERWGLGSAKTTLGCAGFEAVEIALKTALLHTGREGVLAFRGGYHGLGYGAMNVTGWPMFKDPFAAQLRPHVHFLDYPEDPAALERMEKELPQLFKVRRIGAILVEPVQGRGGETIPVPGFLATLREWADLHGAVLIFDEIYTGFFRSGTLFASEQTGVFPDLLCLGKGLSGAYPISACVGKAAVMDAWPENTGDALHTSTFLGNPLGCALALASLAHWQQPEWPEKIRLLSDQWKDVLAHALNQPGALRVRGRGLGWSLELATPELVQKTVPALLRRGILALGGGQDGKRLAFSPPACLSGEDLLWIKRELADTLRAL